MNGIEGLRSQSRHPLNSVATKVSPQYELLILTLRGQRNPGARRIQSELLRQHELSLGLATIHTIKKIETMSMNHTYESHTYREPLLSLFE